MIKRLSIIFIWLFILSGCTLSEGADRISIKLNPGIDTVEIGSSYTDPHATASYGLRKLEVTVIFNDVDTQTLGVYEIIYAASYESYTKTMKRIVTVIDETPPTLTLNPGIDTIFPGDEWVDEGVSAFDLSGDEVIITVVGSVLDEPGRYEIEYIGEDSSGNVAKIVRVVTVLERP